MPPNITVTDPSFHGTHRSVGRHGHVDYNGGNGVHRISFTGLLVTMASSVAPFGMPEKSTVTMVSRHEGTLEGFLKGQRNHLSASTGAPGWSGFRRG